MGAVVVDRSNRIVDTGYNGAPRGLLTGDRGCINWCPRAVPAVDEVVPIRGRLDPHYDDCSALHAEANALMFSDRRHREGGTIYVTSSICGGCAKLISNSGLIRVVCDTSHTPPHRDSGAWFDFMRDCGLTVDEMRH